MLAILNFLISHPLNKNYVNSILRFIRWQIATRFLNLPVITPFVNSTKLIAERGITVGPGNYYVGLLEFEGMAFLLHYLRQEDIFFDIGANIGAYTVLASGVSGAKCFSIEPIPMTYERLIDNININRLETKVHTLNVGLDRNPGVLMFTSGSSTINHVVTDLNTTESTIKIEVTTLDIIAENRPIEMIKIDVEGYEGNVLAGAKHTFSRKNKPNVVLIELRGHGNRYGIEEEQIHNQMLNYGYNPFSYDAINRALKPWIRNQKDVLGDMIYIYNYDKAINRLSNGKPFCIMGKKI